MRHLHNWLAIRIGFVTMLALVVGCAEERAPEATSGLLTDFASGVDAEFGVEAFQVTDPTLKISAPADFFSKSVGSKIAKTNFDLSFQIQFFTVGLGSGKINCYVDGTLAGSATGPSITIADVGFGMHTIGCVLVDANGAEVAVASARAVIRVQVTSSCKVTEDCTDGQACTQDSCIGFSCQWAQANTCCGSAFDCSFGELCQDANTAQSKCSVCAKDLDCDDGSACTTDVCDLTGVKGVCSHNKPDKDCCVSDDKECDDAKGCTIDACNTTTKKCSHVQPPGTCCADSECTSEDVCLVGDCVNYECRFGLDNFKPDCCSTTTNALCDDKLYCTIDACDKPQTGGWSKCSHVQDKDKPNCCDPKGSTLECEDGNSCTYDLCSGFQCYNVQLADCCAVDGDCDDQHICTVDKCTKTSPDDKSGKCSHDWTPECCVAITECNDSKFCTKDTCNYGQNTCQYEKTAGCCDTNDECDDGKFCTVGQCVNYGCVFGKDKFKPNCCDGNVDCSDGDACTLDSCDLKTNQCTFVDSGVEGCCNTPADCDDADCTTSDFCDANSTCSHKAAFGKCKIATDCNDGDACTTDACVVENGCGSCVFTPSADCCLYDSGCDDGKPCTKDLCVDTKCQHNGLAGCCADDKDAIIACDDSNPCTIEYCLNNNCRHTAPKNGCCAVNGDCSDGNKCTDDTCKGIVNGQGTCDFAKVADATCVGCAFAFECDDNNPCTVEKCANSQCIHEVKSGCCLDKFDCDDGIACTIDACISSMNYCIHYEEVGGIKPCCTVENEATECATLNTNCAVGKCLGQPDGTKQCVAVAKGACTYDLNYCQDFASTTKLSNLGWNPVDLSSTAKANWAIATNGGLGPDQYARFNWTPTAINYDTCLTTPIFQAAGANTLTIQFDREFVKNTGLTGIRVLGSLDGENADWTKATLIDQVAPNDNLGPETVDVKLPVELSGSNGLRLAVCVSGSSTFNLTRFGIDNFCIAKGSAPSFTACPSNQTVLAGKVLKVPVKAKDPDATNIVSFSLEKAPSFATISSALYSWYDGTWNTQIVFEPDLGDVGDHVVTIKVFDGHLYKLCTFTITVTFEGGVLVWKPTGVPDNTATPVANAIKALGRQVQVVEDLNLYSDLTKFDAVFILLGVFPTNYSLKEAEIAGLKLFLSQGGRIYMEGGDTWAFDPPTSLHSFFKVEGVLDAAPKGVTGPLKGFPPYTDPAADPVKHFQWGYSASQDWNNVNDQIAGKDVAKTANMLRNDGIEKFWVQVAHDNPTANYRTVASSVLFGGVTTDVDAPNLMMKQIFSFFDNGLPTCNNTAQCDDSNACTTDSCDAGVCKHDNTCLCNGQSSLKCGDVQTKLVSNGGSATQVVDNYPCVGGTVFSGKEVAYGFKNAESAPVTIKLKNVSSAKARLLVLKATAKGCDPEGCIASGIIASGATEVSFPAQENVQYYIVVDAEGASDSATFDLEVICAAGEICDDGKDNNGNGLADCDDWASCCGFPTCGEICDGVDNDCNGTVDDDCDDDGDGYCDVAKKTKKTALCKKSALPVDTSVQDGDDCKDGDTSVNPGAAEICANGKDDNCNGIQDEEGASGCTNFFADFDGDNYGSGVAKCLCQADGAYKSTVGGDCNDADKTINPGVSENCATAADDDCDGDINDVNATGCKNYYTDKDSDNYGVTPFKCICTPTGDFKADKAGDCNDADQTLNPGKAEVCNGIDDNCNGSIDEGCDDDQDGYCDNDLAYEAAPDATLDICPKGAGDSDDNDPSVNPEGKEICDGKDNDSNGQIDEGCDDDGDKYCDSDMIVVGKPASCVNGAGDCNDTTDKINPGVIEDCATQADDNCDGNTNDIGAKGCSPFFYDFDADAFGTSANQCLCVAAGLYVAINPGDCNDTNNLINPQAVEICDNLDNDCDKVIDNGCDDDKDGFCDANLAVKNAPSVCPSGGGDCDDQNANVNPSRAEVCGNTIDENCNGSTNDLNATGCVSFFIDADSDGYGAGAPKCYCAPFNDYKVTLANDCDDTSALTNPTADEICDGKDNNCDGKIDDGCDEDKDGYCALGKTIVAGSICSKGGDCDDNDASVYSGKATEICDGKDDDCNGKIDNGCDDDKDGYCDAALTISNPLPPICSKGVGDCDDFNFDVNPDAPEICNNSIDDNCNNSQNDENAGGCADFFFDADADSYGISLKKCLCSATSAFTAKQAGDCNDYDTTIKPGVTEVCDGKDNNCDGKNDEENASGCTTFYNDADKDGYGIELTKCLCASTGTFTATQAKDCNDAVKAVNPGAAETCNDADDNCDGQVDEGCNADGDDYCAAGKTVVGFPTVCPKGGGDCNDNDPTISTAGNEVCNGADDNCNGTTDEGCDDDGDKFCDANMVTIGTPSSCSYGGGDCDDTKNTINPATPEICGNTVDENCNGSYNDDGAQGCTNFWPDADGDGYGKDGTVAKCLCIKTPEYSAANFGDCDDANNLVNSGATELCDGVDNNCDKVIDEGCDDDNDGYCDADLITIGTPLTCPNGGGDCNDVVKEINPGAEEICGNSVDENCDNSLNSAAGANCTVYYYDGDGDGYGVNVSQCLCTPENGFTASKAGDCDDTANTINPDATEICGNGKDDNCDNNSNEPDAQGCINFYKDGDKDGYGAGSPVCLCTAEGEYLTKVAGDCDDNNKTVKPAGAEVCDGKDNNCNGQTDEGCDDDKDGHCDSAMTITADATCLKSTPTCDGVIFNGLCYQGFPVLKSWATARTECQNFGGDLTSISSIDENNAVRSAATKACGGTAVAWIGLNDFDKEGDLVWSNGAQKIYENWNLGQPDNNVTNNAVRMLASGYWEAANGDNFSCYVCKLGKVSAGAGDDCDDLDPAVSPSAPEICDDKDNNCDGVKDDGCDNDKDGYCSLAKTVVGTPAICTKGKGDCDDSNNLVNPGKSEICDGADNTCDGKTDVGCDDDDDDYCDSAMAIVGTPPTCSKGGGDCVDSDKAVNPGAAEVCGDNKDNNCAGGIDEACNDEDGDGYCKGNQAPGAGCPKGGGDCDDANKLVFPGNKEDCSTGVDDNCNGETNEVDALKCLSFYTDEDKDGYGAGTATCLCSQKGIITATFAGDCDDTNAIINPNATEVCDGVDNSCSGKVDQGCDEDNDGFCATGMLVVDNIACPKTGTVEGPSCTKTSPSFIGSVVNMDTRSHGGGHHHFRKEFWYPQWNGPTVYRYNDAYAYQGNFNGGQNNIMGLEGDSAEDAWYTANWGEATVSRHNGMTSSVVWAKSIGTTAGGVAIHGNTVYGFQNSGATVYVFDKANGSQIKTFKLSPYLGSSNYGGTFIHKDMIWLPNPDSLKYFQYSLAGTPTGEKFDVQTQAYNGAYDGTKICISANSSSVYCYEMGKFVCNIGDDCNDKEATVNPESAEICDDLDNNCNSTVDEGCDDDQDGYCDDNAVLPFGNCCSQHASIGCSVSTIQACVCSKPGYGFCCTGNWTADCATAAKNFGCATCKFPATCPAGGGDCNDLSNKVNPGGKEVCGTADDDDCDGTFNTINADGCVKYYQDKDNDGFGISTFQCQCVAEGDYRATVDGDCDDNDPKTYAGFASELCDGKDNNCNGKIDETCDADGDGYCDAGKIVLTNEACPKSSGSDANCGDKLLSDGSFLPRTIGVNPHSTGGGYHAKLGEFWMPEYTSAYATTVHRYTSSAPYKEIGSFDSGLRYVRQIAGDASDNSWYAATYDSSTNSGLYRMSGTNNTKMWTSASLTTLLSAVAVDADLVYTMRYNSSQVYVVNRADGLRRTDKEFGLSTQTGSTYGIGFYDGKFFRTSDSAWIYRYDMNGGHDGTKIQMTTNGYAIASTATEICYSNGTTMPICVVLPKAGESYGSEINRAYHYSHGAGYHKNRKEFWYPEWAGSTIYRYDAKMRYLGGYNSGQGQMMQVYGDSDIDAWYSANWGYNTITRRDGLATNAKWSFNIGSTAGSAAVEGNVVYAMRSSGQTVWKINRDTGGSLGTFNLSGWWPGDTSYGGLIAHEGKLWRLTAGRWAARYNQSNGAWDGSRLYLDTNPYSMTWDGVQVCYSPNNNYSYCQTLPDTNVTFDITSSGVGGSSTPGLKRSMANVNVQSYGGAWHPKNKEYWFPQWTGAGSTTTRRYNVNGGYVGNTTLPAAYIMDLWFDTDGSWATANWGEGRVRRFNAGNGNTWNYGMGGTIGGVTGDDRYVYGMRYNSSTVWVIDKNNGAGKYTFGLNGMTTYLYGGLEMAGDTLMHVTNNNYVRFFNKYTGRNEGVSFRTHTGSTSIALYNGDDLCVGNSGSTQTLYCYGIKDTAGNAVRNRVEIANDARSHGGGYHPYHKEYWHPEWAGDYVYRYNQNKRYVSEFRCGRGQIMGLAGDPATKAWYTAEWSYNTISGYKDVQYGPTWTTNIGSTAGAVAVDANNVYGLRSGNSTVYKLNKTNGSVVSTFNLTSGSYISTLYGGAAIVGDSLYRGNSTGSVERYSLTTGKYDGTSFYMNRDIHAASFDPVSREFCGYHNSYPGESYCMALPLGGNSGTRSLGMDARSYGGGYSSTYKEYWYPEWNASDSTEVYRYDDEGKELGSFNSGLRNVIQIWSDVDTPDWFGAVQNGSSTYSRIYRMKAKSATKVWTSPYVTTYWAGVTADKSLVYTMRQPGDPHVYVFDHANGTRRADKEFDLTNWNSNSSNGLALIGTKFYRATLDNTIWRYDMNGVHDGVQMPVAVNPDAVAWNGKELCISDNVTPSLVYCYKPENVDQNYNAKTYSVATYGEGAGFHNFRNEYWFPLWSSTNTNIYRYDGQKNLKGLSTVTQRYIRQIWGDTGADAWFSANWSDASITRRRGLTSDLDWTYAIGNNPGGVAGDETAIYAMIYNQDTVHKINKQTGKAITTYNLTGGRPNYLYGGLGVAMGKIFYGASNSWVYRYDLATGVHDNVRFTMPTGIYGATLDGSDYCVAGSAANNTQLFCVPVVGTTCTKGDDCDDLQPSISPGAAERCDNDDNNCDGYVDEGCDADGDGYCTTKLVVIGTPSVCVKGGGDCDDTSAVVNPANPEVCDGKDNNCDKVVDEPGSVGCTSYYYDGDQDGYGIKGGTKCLCAGAEKGLYSASSIGDCDDTCPDCAPGKPELCDGKNNDCSVVPMNGSVYSRQVNLGGYQAQHGSGYHPFLNEYWYNAWSGQTIYRFNTSGGYKGAFNSGQNEMMGFAGDVSSTDYYSANWGNGTVTRRKLTSTGAVWSRSIGAYPSGIAADDKYVYVNKDYSEFQKIYVFDRNTGADVAAKPHFNLSGGGNFSANGDLLSYGGLSIVGDKLYRTTRNRYTYRYNVSDGKHDGVVMYTVPPSTYVDSSVVSNNEICVSSYGYTYLRCYTLPDAGADLTTSTTLNMPTYSHGAGFHPKRSEYWHGSYTSSSSTQIYRFNTQLQAVGNFNSSQRYVRQIAGDPLEDSYYVATYYDGIRKLTGLSANVAWTRDLGNYEDGVFATENKVYAMMSTQQTVYEIDRGNGNITKSFNLSTSAGDWVGDTLYGSLAVIGSKLYRGSGSSRWIYGYNLSDGSHDGTKIYTDQNIYNMAFNGTDICISGGNAPMYCYNPGSGVMTIDKNCDVDGDGYCDDNKVTVGKPAVCPKGGGDCDDSSSIVNPLGLEICNGFDENCNGVIDEGASFDCGANKNAEGACIEGACKIVKCNTGWYDLNTLGTDGCECLAVDSFEPNNSCGAAFGIQQVNDNDSGTVNLTARMVDPSDEDWFKFYAYDSPDSGSGVCDNFNVRARFLKNPSNALRFEVWRGVCPPGNFPKETSFPSVPYPTAVCCGQTEFNWFTNFKAYTKSVYSSQYSEFGECGCSTNGSQFHTMTGYNYGPSNPGPSNSGIGGPYGRWNASAGSPVGQNPYNGSVKDRNQSSQSWGYDYTRCHDDSAWFFLKVYRVGTVSQCSDYQVEISNGVYGAPATKDQGYKITEP